MASTGNPLNAEIERLRSFHPQFGFAPIGGGSGGGIGFPSPGGINIGYNPPPVTIGVGGGSGGSSKPGSIAGSIGSAIFNNLFGGVGSQLLRLVLLILGLICIAGAIYLFKPTSEIIAAPARAAKNAAKAAAAGAVAA